jgi:aryl-alcohol dehydrogenase-like predicted oxidoreductase
VQGQADVILNTQGDFDVKISSMNIDGVERPVSRFVIGCDNKNDLSDALPVWDAWLEVGGNAFDTAWLYGGGRHETVLGEWIKLRGISKDIVVVAKGAHTPHCTPAAIGEQLTQSLDRLQLSHVPIYVMHRDNVEVPVGEFVDALNQEISAGRISVYGGSNWSIERFAAAKAYAESHGLKAPTILNNNLALAVMEKPVWAGCISSNSPATLSYLRTNNMAHFSWSSQARGYFLPEDLRNRLPLDTAPETCFGSASNAERRMRAEHLAKKYDVSAHNIAAAWVLGQSFPSFAIVGPRTAEEIMSSLPAFAVTLTQEEIAWLNLE